jgi:curli biogenesis system outer membrane secretion channel CsgG
MRPALFASAAALLVAAHLPAQTSDRPVVALRDFEFTAQLSREMQQELNGMTGLAVLLGRTQDPRVSAQTNAEAAAGQFNALLTDALLEGGHYRIMERDKLSAVTDEQDLGRSTRAAAGQTTAQTGALRTAQYVLAGSITKFAKVDKRSTLGGVLARIPGGGAAGRMVRGKTFYEVEVVVKVIEASSGEVLTSVRTQGTSEGGQNLSVAGGGILGSVVAGSLSSSSSGDRELRLAEALAEASVLAAEKLAERRSMLTASRN